MRALPWYATTDHKLWVAWTLAGVIRIKANTFPPWHLRTQKLLGYSVYCGTYRLSWTPDLTVAIDVAENLVMAHMQKRKDKA